MIGRLVVIGGVLLCVLPSLGQDDNPRSQRAREAARQAQQKQEEKPAAEKQEGDAEKKPRDKKAIDVLEDKEHELKISAPKGWQVDKKDDYTVPGELLRAWSEGKVNEGNIVVFLQEPESEKPITPRFILDSEVSKLKAADVEVRKQEIIDVGGKRAMMWAGLGRGTGGAMTGEGTVKTYQQCVAIPREKDVVVLLLTTPEKGIGRKRKLFEEMLKTVEIGGKQTEEQTNSK